MAKNRKTGKERRGPKTRTRGEIEQLNKTPRVDKFGNKPSVDNYFDPVDLIFKPIKPRYKDKHKTSKTMGSTPVKNSVSVDNLFKIRELENKVSQGLLNPNQPVSSYNQDQNVSFRNIRYNPEFLTGVEPIVFK